jgi:hypothetical protein
MSVEFHANAGPAAANGAASTENVSIAATLRRDGPVPVKPGNVWRFCGKFEALMTLSLHDDSKERRVVQSRVNRLAPQR